MLIIFYLLLMLGVGRCTDDLIFVTQTAAVGDIVTLTCSRSTSERDTVLYWIRVVSGSWPEFLGGTFTFNYDGVNETPHFTTKQEPGTFTLHIRDTKPSDTGLYYCVKVTKLDLTFGTGTFLTIKGPESDITAIIQLPPADPVHPGDLVTVQCSVISDYKNKACEGDHSVFWFRAGSDESHPTLIHALGNSDGECERSPEGHSAQKCVYNFSKTVSSSDAGTYYCTVATCGEILFGNGSTLDVPDYRFWPQRVDAVFPLCAVLAVSLIVIAFLICAVKKNKCDCCKAAAGLKNDCGGQKYEDTWIYSAAVFTMMKADSGARKDAKAAERERIYAATKAFGLDYQHMSQNTLKNLVKKDVTEIRLLLERSDGEVVTVHTTWVPSEAEAPIVIPTISSLSLPKTSL